MRASALSYMIKRGIPAGTAILMSIILVSSLLSDSGYAGTALQAAGGNVLTVVVLYLTTSFIPAAFIGGIGGGVIGLLIGLYTRDFVRRYYNQITDTNQYALALAWRTAGLSVALTLAAVMLFFSPMITVWSLALIILTALAGGLIGRGFAFYDMKQRREKKDVSQDTSAAVGNGLHRLELHDETRETSSDDEDAPLSQHRVIR